MTFRIEIAGSIAAGKSTLCKGLQENGFEIISERLEENPFLNRDYPDPATRGFDVQMAFLLSKAAAISAYNGPSSCIVVDYALAVEYAYNDIHLKKLSAQGHALSGQVIDFKRQQTGEPDALIVLDCPVSEQLRRIRRRGRNFEQQIDDDYLETLNAAITRHLGEKTEPGTKILRLDTSREDPRQPATIEKVRQFIADCYLEKTGRQLLYPAKQKPAGGTRPSPF